MRLRELCALLALVTFETRERGLDEMVQFVVTPGGGGWCLQIERGTRTQRRIGLQGEMMLWWCCYGGEQFN